MFVPFGNSANLSPHANVIICLLADMEVFIGEARLLPLSKRVECGDNEIISSNTALI